MLDDVPNSIKKYKVGAGQLAAFGDVRDQGLEGLVVYTGGARRLELLGGIPCDGSLCAPDTTSPFARS